MTFKGIGIVRRRGLVIAKFIEPDNLFSTEDQSIIAHLKELGFKIVEPATTEKKQESTPRPSRNKKAVQKK